MIENYYRKTLGIEDWRRFSEYALWLHDRCDSQLEILFGISFLHQFETASDGHFDLVSIEGEQIVLNEPFLSSPTGNGRSKAWLTAQEVVGGRVFDFGIYVAGDNGAVFSESRLSVLLEIDGYGAHRSKRSSDEEKSRSCEHRVVRFPEERFKSVHQMARAGLYATVWDCDCGPPEAVRDWPCEFCDDLINRVVG